MPAAEQRYPTPILQSASKRRLGRSHTVGGEPGFRLESRAFERLGLALVPALALGPAATGCVYAEVLGGYSVVSAPSPVDPEVAVSRQATEADPGFALGINIGVVTEVDRDVRVAAGGGAHLVHTERGAGATSDHGTTGAMLRGDYAPVQFGRRSRFGGAMALFAGEMNSRYAEEGGQQGSGSESRTALGGWVGPALTWVVSDDVSLTPGLGAEYIATLGGGAERIRAVGPQVRFVVTWNLMGNNDARSNEPDQVLAAGAAEVQGGNRDQSAQGVELGDAAGTVIKFTTEVLSRADAIASLAEGAIDLGCDVVDRATDRFVAICTRGAIGFVQEGERLAAVCVKQVPREECAGMLASILKATERRAEHR